MDSQVLDPEMVKDLRKAKEDTEWVPSKGQSKVRFMKPQIPSDLFSGLIALGAGIVVSHFGISRLGYCGRKSIRGLCQSDKGFKWARCSQLWS